MLLRATATASSIIHVAWKLSQGRWHMLAPAGSSSKIISFLFAKQFLLSTTLFEGTFTVTRRVSPAASKYQKCRMTVDHVPRTSEALLPTLMTPPCTFRRSCPRLDSSRRVLFDMHTYCETRPKNAVSMFT